MYMNTFKSHGEINNEIKRRYLFAINMPLSFTEASSSIKDNEIFIANK